MTEKFAFLFLGYVVLSACSTVDLEEINHKELISEASILKDNNFVFQGQLQYVEIIPSKTWESYDGLEFFLNDNHGFRFPLEESNVVSKNQLKDFIGKKIEVNTYAYQPANCPSGQFCGAFPVDSLGNQLRRTVRFKVTNIKALE